MCLTCQVIIGSPELKANQSIRQVIEVVTDLEKYSRYDLIATNMLLDGYLYKFIAHGFFDFTG